MKRDIETTATMARTLRELHLSGPTLVLPNAWDAASARVFEAAGFPAIATTSGGVAAALGYRDGEDAPLEEMLSAAARIIAAVEIPVSVDFEAGYGLTSSQFAERLISIGAAGFNLEDSDLHGSYDLVAAEFQANRISEIRSACRALGADLVINARVDVFIRRVGTEEEQSREGHRRANLYKEAGADSIYPIALSDRNVISRLIAAAGVVNLNLRRGGPISIRDAMELGVRRISYATSIFRAALATTQQVAEEIWEENSTATS